MNGDVINLLSNVGGTFLLAVCGWIFRSVRRNLRAIRFAQTDISTIWLHLNLPRKLRSGSYRFPRYGEEE